MSKRHPVQGPTPEAKRCAIYTRKSTTMGLEQDFNSLDAQHEACAAYIRRQPGWTLVEQTYADGGFTGANIDRPAFQRLLADVEAGKIDVVVVYKVDRLSRSLLDFAKVMERFNAGGASFVSVTQNFSTADAMGRLTLNMLMSFAEFEREMIAERTRDKIAMSRRKGKWTGGPVPFGYSAKDKRLVVNEVEASIVREAFALFLQHRRIFAVAGALNERGLLPRGCPARPAKHGLRWTKDSMARLLRSPIYAGQMMYGKELYPGEHPRLVDDATFRRAQRILEGAERELRFGGLNPEYVLRGLLRCASCGDPMTPASTRKGKGHWRYYRCSGRDKHGKAVCQAKPLPAGAIEAFVVDKIAEATQDGSLAAEVKTLLDARIEKKRSDIAELRGKLPGRVADAAANAARYSEDLLKFEGRARELIEKKLRAEADRLAAAERQLAETERDLLDLHDASIEADWVAGAIANFSKVWELMTPENRCRLLRALVVSVKVDEKSSKVEIELVDFAGDPEAKRREGKPKEAA
jgi:DNA invertase Pin-like site-specific DNA recombinase